MPRLLRGREGRRGLSPEVDAGVAMIRRCARLPRRVRGDHSRSCRHQRAINPPATRPSGRRGTWPHSRVALWPGSARCPHGLFGVFAAAAHRKIDAGRAEVHRRLLPATARWRQSAHRHAGRARVAVIIAFAEAEIESAVFRSTIIHQSRTGHVCTVWIDGMVAIAPRFGRPLPHSCGGGWRAGFAEVQGVTSLIK